MELIIITLGVSIEIAFKENVSMGSNLGDLARSFSFDRLGICGFKRENDGIVWMMLADTTKPVLTLFALTFLYNKRRKMKRLMNSFPGRPNSDQRDKGGGPTG